MTISGAPSCANAGEAATANSKTAKTARIISPYWYEVAGTLRKSQGKFVYIGRRELLNYLVTLTISDTWANGDREHRVPAPTSSPSPAPRLSAYDLWRTDRAAAAH